jgi:hypothetical protein
MTFKDWFYEIENFSMRCERFYDDLVHYQGDNAETIVRWLEAAYQSGYEARMNEITDDGK